MITLISKKNNQYKANLHSHSVVSDGCWTPEEMKEHYKQHGYSIIAFTDHEGFVCHNELTDSEFLALNGMEIAIREDGDKHWKLKKSIHINLLATNPEITKQPFFHSKKYFYKPIWSFKTEDLDIDKSEADYERILSPECINEIIEISHKKSFLVSYNHPSEVPHRYPQYSKYCGFDFVEIINGCSAIEGKPCSTDVLDDYLSEGKKVFAIGADDNHNKNEDFAPSSPCYRAYTVICAEELSYSAVIDALKKGNFYTGTGDFYNESPKILYLAYEPETRTVHIKTTNALEIHLLSGIYDTSSKFAEYGKVITEAELKVSELANYFRIEIIDEKGKKTYSNPYFIKDFS